jgi:hypothetical protein
MYMLVGAVALTYFFPLLWTSAKRNARNFVVGVWTLQINLGSICSEMLTSTSLPTILITNFLTVCVYSNVLTYVFHGSLSLKRSSIG